MKTRFCKRQLWFVASTLLLLLVIVQVVQAHDSRTIGPYRFTVGFINEPAFEGQKNGVDLRVSRGEGEDATPVEGLEETLQVEVTHVESGASEVMALRTIFGKPGHYTNDWIPTAPGQYRFRFFGTVEEMQIDEAFQSGPETFGSVETAEALHFPETVPAARELEGAVRGAQTSADEALATALASSEQISTLRTLAIVAIVLTLVAIIASVVAFRAARRA